MKSVTTNVTPLLLQQIVAFLSTRDSHSIYDHAEAGAAFTAATGELPPWPTHTKQNTQRRIAGSYTGGYVEGADDTIMCYGYEMAYSLAEHYIGFRSQKVGRGFMFHDCIDALVKAIAASASASAEPSVKTQVQSLNESQA
jgi:hypothetical protein